jgi:hypothetical protein
MHIMHTRHAPVLLNLADGDDLDGVLCPLRPGLCAIDVLCKAHCREGTAPEVVPKYQLVELEAW